MRTLSDAVMCLRHDGPSEEVNIEVDRQGSATATVAVSLSAVNLSELGKEIAASKEIDSLENELRSMLMGRIKSGGITPSEAMYSHFLAAFTYGVRTGIEMEKG